VCFGSALADVQRYARWLATAGVERGLLGPREVDRLWQRHLLNSAALAPWLPARGSVLDLGSGAGLPGVVIALLRPDLEVVLLEPLLRRATFLTEVVADLQLPRTEVVRARAEDYATSNPESVDAVVARAVAPMGRLIGWASPLITQGGFLLALKGETVSQELDAAEATRQDWGMATAEVHPVATGTSLTQVVSMRRVGPITAAETAARSSGSAKPAHPARQRDRAQRRKR